MQELGTEISSKSNDEYLIFKTVCHGGDSDKLYFYINSKKFYCFSKCGKLSVYDVIMKTRECGFKEAFDFLLNFTKGYSKPITGFNLFGYKTKNIEDVEVHKLDEIDKPFLYNVYSKKEIKEWSREEINYEVQQQFKIRYDIKNNRAIIPVFDDNICVGIRTRNFNKIDIERKGKYIPLFYDDKCYNFPTSQILYGLDITKENIKKYNKIIITEGEKSVLRCQSYYPNGNCCVAMFGSNLSNTQKKIILDLAGDNKSFEVIMAMDKEFEVYDSQERIEYEKKIIKNLEGLSQYCKCSYIIDKNGLLDMKDSPLDKGRIIFSELIKSRELIN